MFGNFDDWCKNNNMVLNVSISECLIIGSRRELQIIDYDVKLNVGDILLEYVNKFCYLGNYLYREMTLISTRFACKKGCIKQGKSYFKIRKYITTKCALAIHKQTILPLQMIQNDILRCCYKLFAWLDLADMHPEASLVSLEQPS